MLVSCEDDPDNTDWMAILSNEDTSKFEGSLTNVSNEDKSTDGKGLRLNSCVDDPKGETV